MSGIRIVNPAYFHKSYGVLFILFAIIFINTNKIVTNAEETGLVETVNTYKCNGSKLPSGYEIYVPSYAFHSEVTLRIKEYKPFPGCQLSGGDTQKLTETQLFYFQGPQSEVDDEERQEIESHATSINPRGILNVQNQFYDPDEYCILDYTEANNVTKVPSLTFQYCPHSCSNAEKEGSQLCIQKCCSLGKVVDFEEGHGYHCEFSGNKSWSGFFYDENSWKSISKCSDKEKSDKFKKPHYFKESMSETCNGSNYEVWVMRKLVDETLAPSRTRLLTNGQLIHISAHRSWKLLDTTKFCIDGIQNVGGRDSSPYYSGDERDQVVFICAEDSVDEPDDKLSTLYMYSLFVASLFYLATTIIYALLWDKQNTHGWTVFSLVFSQFLMCLFIGNAHRMGLDEGFDIMHSSSCIANGILAHFFTLASFTWLTVVNFELWSTLRSSRHQTKADLKKFSMYSFIGWGTPLTVVTIGVILDHLFPDRESLVLVPEYGSYICYVAPWAQGPYVYYIMAFLLAVTVSLSILTFSEVHKFHKETVGTSSSPRAGDRQMFSLYAKLSVILGTSWIFEFISWAASSEDHQHWIWVIFDMYNLLTAVFIFVIFVCKRTTLTQLIEKYSCLSCLKPINEIMKKSITVGSNDGTGSSSVVTQRSGNQQEMESYGVYEHKEFPNSALHQHSQLS